MKYLFILMILLSTITNAQNITISTKYSKIFSKNLDNIYSIEGNFPLYEELFKCGFFMGIAKLHFTDYSFPYNNDENQSRIVYGISFSYFPFAKLEKLYSGINISTQFGKIGKNLKSSGGMFIHTGYYNPITLNDYFIDLLLGLKTINNGLGLYGNIGIKYRKYDEQISYIDIHDNTYKYTKPKDEISFFMEIGLQYRF